MPKAVKRLAALDRSPGRDEAVPPPPPSPPPSPSAVNHRTVVGRHRRADTRLRIVEAAATVYGKKGPDTAVIDDFVKAAGMSRGTFYNYFTTTNELLNATVAWFEKRLTHSIVSIISHYPDPVQKSAMAMRLHLQWVTSDPVLCALFSSVPQVAEVGRREASALLREGMAAGAFEVDNFVATLDLVFGTLSETIRRIDRAPTRPRRCNEVVRLVLCSLGVDRERIAEALALPLPDIPMPVRLLEAVDALDSHDAVRAP